MAKQPLDDALDDSPKPTAEEVRAALERILQSPCFEHAGRASDFLRFVVTKTLAGEASQLKGYTIGVQVFGRPADFDAQSDPLVRVEALRLRQRLAEYYAGDGAADRVRLDLPRGSYGIKATYTSTPPARGTTPASSMQAWSFRPLRPLRGWAVWAAVALLLIGAAGGIAVQYPPHSDQEQAPQLAADNVHVTKIYVVPLENLSTRPALDGLAAALTEEIMLRLDALDLYVVAMQTQWYRPGKGLDGVLGEEHSYVLTGSVRDYAGGARITLRIIEAETGAQIWSAAYDEQAGIEQQPARQGRIASDAAAAAGPFGPVFDAELAVVRRSSHTLELPDCQTRYRAFRRATDSALFPEALACFQSLVARQPKLAEAWAGLAMLFIDEHVYYSGGHADGSAFARADSALRRALSLDDRYLLANIALVRYQYYAGSPEFHETAVRVLAMEPNNPELLGLVGILLTAYGDATHGLELVDRAHELSPEPRPMFDLAKTFAHLQDGEPCEALARTGPLEPSKWFITHMLAAAAAGLCGDVTAADQARGKLLAVVPNFEAEAFGLIHVWQFEPRLRAAVIEGLRKAGFMLHEQR